MKPKVSIVIPCYNSQQWIEECVLSALKQTYENIEVVCVDNESTDNTFNIVKEIQQKHPQLITSTAPNIYPHCWDEAREEGFKHITGDYVTIIGSDDYMSENYIENCMNFILSAPDQVLAFQSPVWGVRSHTGQTMDQLSHFYPSLEDFKKQCLVRCPVNTPTVIYNVKLLNEGLLKAQPELYGGAADYDLYCKLADNNVMIYPAPRWLGFYYRWHPQQATWKVQHEGKGYDQMIQTFWKEKWNL